MMHVSVVSKLLDEMADQVPEEQRRPLKIEPELYAALSSDRERFPYVPRRNDSHCSYGHPWPEYCEVAPNGRRICPTCQSERQQRPRYHLAV